MDSSLPWVAGSFEVLAVQRGEVDAVGLVSDQQVQHGTPGPEKVSRSVVKATRLAGAAHSRVIIDHTLGVYA